MTCQEWLMLPIVKDVNVRTSWHPSFRWPASDRGRQRLIRKSRASRMSCFRTWRRRRRTPPSRKLGPSRISVFSAMQVWGRMMINLSVVIW